jgi:hypothetical protein
MLTRRFASLPIAGFVAILLVAGAFGDSNSNWKSLPSHFLKETRGGNAQLGKCSVTCVQWQGINSQTGNWSCTGDAEGAPCDSCSDATTAVTYPDQASTTCPGNNYTQGAAQNCGKSSIAFTGTCVSGVCTGLMFHEITQCSQPKSAVAQTK